MPRSVFFAATVLWLAAIVWGQPGEQNPAFWTARGRQAEGSGDLTAAAEAYSRAIELGGGSPGLTHRRGEILLQVGQVEEALADFDRAIAQEPGIAPYSWQRGIALYEAGRFDDCRRQFDLHRSVNPNDVENSAWHFLCNARANGVEQARRDLLIVAGDPRVPMREVLALFAGEASEPDVLEAARAGDSDGADLANRLFYAHLYIGLFHEAQGRLAEAHENLRRAVDGAELGHTMWRLAQVHVQRFEEAYGDAVGSAPSTRR